MKDLMDLAGDVWKVYNVKFKKDGSEEKNHPKNFTTEGILDYVKTLIP